MKPRLSHLWLSIMLILAPLAAFAQEHDHASEGAPEVRMPNPVSMQMLVIPIIIIAVLAFNAFRKRK